MYLLKILIFNFPQIYLFNHFHHMVRNTQQSEAPILVCPCRYPPPRPPQPRRGWPHHRGLRPLLFSNSSVGSFTSHENQISESAVRRDLRFFVLIRKEQKVYPFADVTAKAALSPQLFKDPGCWSGRGLNPRPPVQQTDALLTELAILQFSKTFIPLFPLIYLR